jgi:hypothetical protein
VEEEDDTLGLLELEVPVVELSEVKELDDELNTSVEDVEDDEKFTKEYDIARPIGRFKIGLKDLKTSEDRAW